MVTRVSRSSIFIVLVCISQSAVLISSFVGTRGVADFEMDQTLAPASSIQVAHLGNSIQYFNDCPRLLERIFKDYYGEASVVTQDSCLRGGASLLSLLAKGNGMANKFATPNALQPDGTYDIGSPTVEDLLQSDHHHWDFVIMNDHTQSPARHETRTKTVNELKISYLSLLTNSDQERTPVVIFLMTAAYRKPVKDADQLGSFDDFTAKLKEGYAHYQQAIPNSRVAPVGLAFQYVKNNYPKIDNENDLSFNWEWLYARDDFHPSPHGTLLEAFVLFSTIVGQKPPMYDLSWWDKARYMQPPDVDPLPLPTLEEGALLRDVACAICGVVGINTRTCVEEEVVGGSSSIDDASRL